ncbi:MAG: DUF58 domain-containing protein [Cyanobacteria bacterium RI_101]|nr:DUF58 domain-containing protein [Cyanobacteria bacterium RI_101]
MAHPRSFSPADWLERRWAAPSYGGWLLFALGLCFFGAATNTMSGWLYVLSGLIFALLLLGAWFPLQSLKALTFQRPLSEPVSAGEELTLVLEINNPGKTAKTLLQLWDLLPPQLGRPQGKALEYLAPQSRHTWRYYLPAPRRGVYRWQTLEVRTGAPLGLFWCRRAFSLQSRAIVYPQVLPLNQCPLVDAIGAEESPKLQSSRRYLAANEGVTKTLRPYRYGDSMRLIHWRSSARFDEFQVRELEVITGGQDVAIALDTASAWEEEDFEQAVIAAASLYFYAQRMQLTVRLWTAAGGLVSGARPVLETLAATQRGEPQQEPAPENAPLIWITTQPQTLGDLPLHSRWLLFPPGEAFTPAGTGLIIDRERDLGAQLSQPLPLLASP